METFPVRLNSGLSVAAQEWTTTICATGESRGVEIINACLLNREVGDGSERIWDGVLRNGRLFDGEPEMMRQHLLARDSAFFEGMPCKEPRTPVKEKALLGKWVRSHVMGDCRWDHEE